MNIASRRPIIYTVDYLDGYQYESGKLLFFPTAEGYVKYTEGVQNPFDYVFNYTDHLGNIRLSYGINPATGLLKKMEENNYYPFGLKHGTYNIEEIIIAPRPVGGPIAGKMGKFMMQKEEPFAGILDLPTQEPTLVPNFYSGYGYKYNGKELQNELGLNMYDFQAMLYDPATGRRNNVDPKAELSRRWSTYSYCYDNPMYFVDPDGMEAKPSPLEAAIMAKHVYGGNVKLIGGWKVSAAGKGLDLNNDRTGFKSQVYERTVKGKTEYTYATAGTEDRKDAKQDVKQVFGMSEQYSQSVAVAGDLKDKIGGAELTYTGHSLGGGLAEANSIATGDNAVTFNAAGLSVFSPGGLQKSDKTDAYILTTDPLNAAQSATGLPTAGGTKHFVGPGSTQGAANGHSIDSVIEGLQTKSTGQFIKNTIDNFF